MESGAGGAGAGDGPQRGMGAEVQGEEEVPETDGRDGRVTG